MTRTTLFLLSSISSHVFVNSGSILVITLCMLALAVSRRHIRARCLCANRRWRHSRLAVAGSFVRQYGDAAAQRKQLDEGHDGQNDCHEEAQHVLGRDDAKQEGALTRRLRAMSEEAMESGGHGALKSLEDAGFSGELKAQLEQRIAAANLRSSEADLSTAASRHTRDLATAEPWTGSESIHDASLRMLNDAHKPMRLGRPPKAPGVQPPQAIDTGHKRSKEERGHRLANARDRSTVYASLKDDADLEAAEREKRFQALKERFEPHARAIVPGSIQGLASLANKRIEDAIARGQFKNIPRGKGKNVERDYNASSPFIDTTEYFMNKIIQKQDIVPPWIEKQQELASAAAKFRSRLRADWKRHAARMIASRGGSLQDQIRRAEAYASAELIANPMKRRQETLTAVNDNGHFSQISLSGGLKVTSRDPSSMAAEASQEITIERITLDTSTEVISRDLVTPIVEATPTLGSPAPIVPPAPKPFRDSDWERIELTYQTLAIKDLNDKARSYNLLAPELAKRPYFNLQRELMSCYADVAPRIAAAILDRARMPPKSAKSWHNSGEKSVFDSMTGGPVRVRDERKDKQYGLKQFWKELWASKPASPI